MCRRAVPGGRTQVSNVRKPASLRRPSGHLVTTPTQVNPVSLRTLLTLAMPIIISRSTQVVIGLSDALMVAPLGEGALAATTTGAFNSFAFLILPMGICFIVSSFASQLVGAGDAVGARRYGFYGLGIAIGTQVICFAGIPFLGTLLGFFDFEPAVRAEMTSYMVIRLAMGGAAIGMEALASYYGGIGNTTLPMRANLLAMVINVALNAVLIFGLFGAPAMGVSGAALASAIATAIAFAVLLAVFLHEGKRLGRIIPALRLGEFARMLRYGLPSGFNWFFEFFAFNFFVNVVVAGLGTTALAAMMSVLNINSFSFMPAFGLASAGAILVGQSIGAGRKDEVPGIVRMTITVNCIWQGLVGLVYVGMPVLLFRPFAQGDPHLLEVGARMLMLSAAWQLFDATVNSVAESLRAAGDTLFPLVARLSVAWLVFVPGSWVSVRVLGGGDLVAIGWVVGYLAALAAILWLRFRSGAWRRIELVDPLAGVVAPEAAQSTAA